MAAVTRPKAPRAPATKAPSKAKSSSRPKASNKATGNTGATTRSTAKATRDPPAAPVIDVPAPPSPGTATPDQIDETDIEAPNDQNILRLFQAELAKARSSQSGSEHARTHRVHKSHSRRRHRRRYYSPESSTDSEEGDRPRVSFLHHDEGTKPFLDLAARFPTVLMNHFKQIFFGTFAPENLTKLGQGMADRAAAEAPQDAKGMAHMLLCLEVYSQIVLHFSAVSLLGPLQQSLSQYRVRLIEMSVVYKFDSIRTYNAIFMRTRILLGQDDAAA